jgi:hypothetical protein
VADQRSLGEKQTPLGWCSGGYGVSKGSGVSLKGVSNGSDRPEKAGNQMDQEGPQQRREALVNIVVAVGSFSSYRITVDHSSRAGVVRLLISLDTISFRQRWRVVDCRVPLSRWTGELPSRSGVERGAGSGESKVFRQPDRVKNRTIPEVTRAADTRNRR